MGNHDFGDDMCPRYQRAVEILGKRWTALIIRTLLSRPRRFSDITTIVSGLSDRLLSERLKELEGCGIVIRQVYSETPVRIEYVLTTKGRELEQVVEAIQRWADCWGEPAGVPAPEETTSVVAKTFQIVRPNILQGSAVAINAEWHKAHRMPKNPTEGQRLDWHIEHAKHCTCRPIPPKLAAQINARNKK